MLQYLALGGAKKAQSLPQGTRRFKRRDEETDHFGLSVMRRWEVPTGNQKRKSFLGLTQSGGIRGILKGGGLSERGQNTEEREGMGVAEEGTVREGCSGRARETFMLC